MALMLVGFAVPASAGVAEPGQAATAARPACVEEAVKRAPAAWLCVGSTLIVNGVAEEIGDSAVVVTPHPRAGTQDDYDSWCEPMYSCSRTISSYIAETKANVWYGYNGTDVGRFDMVLRINLNGRSARYNTSVIWDGGPALYFSAVQANCFEEIALSPDVSCGNHNMGLGFTVRPAAYRWNSITVHGNPLRNSNEYYTQLSGQFTPTGYPALGGIFLRGVQFNCYGTSNDPCYFP